MTDLERAAARLRQAKRVSVLTGAGVSAASGIPTFRSAGGLWRNFRPETLATADAFAGDPKLVWEWYDWRRGLIMAAQPNAAHHVLADWVRNRPGMTLITQNVDGLHERAGADPIIRLHGSIWHLRCWGRCPQGQQDWTDETCPLKELPPKCPHCGGLARPGVVWFGESLDPAIVAAAHEATVCDVFLTIGTSAVVYPAAGLVNEARRRGAFTVEINPDETPASPVVDVSLRMPAADALVRLGAR